MTQIVDCGFTRFGRREDDLVSMSVEPVKEIVEKNRDVIDFVVVSNGYSGEYNDVSGLNNLITTRLSLDEVPSFRLDNTSGSGGAALLASQSLIESGIANNVLVIGTEKMTSVVTKKSSRIIASLLNPEERKAGLSLPSLAAFFAKGYMEKYGAKRESLAEVSVKNHFNASMNPIAQFQKPVDLEAVMSSRVIADPLRIYEFCPISDGASAVLMASDGTAGSFSGKAVKVSATALASSSSSVSERATSLTIDCVKNSAKKALSKAELSPDQIDVAELHDMATILEIAESEDIGFFKKGEGWKAVLDSETSLQGSIPINPSGGLNSRGHALGATGIAQAAEIYNQLTGSCGPRQVKNAARGLSVNMAGFGYNASTTIYEVI